MSDGYSGCRWLCLVMFGRGVGSEWFVIRAEVGGYTFYPVSWATLKKIEMDHHTHLPKFVFLSPPRIF